MGTSFVLGNREEDSLYEPYDVTNILIFLLDT